MTKKLILPGLLGLIAAVVLSACGEKVTPDPYKLVTLSELTQGDVVSKQFKYKLQNPQIEVLYKNLGMLRDGNDLQVIGARSLEDKLKGTTGFLELSVVKQFSPYVHFKVERIVADQDTNIVPGGGTIAWPLMTSADKYGTDAYETKDINTIPYNNTGVLKGIKDKKLSISAPITMEQEEGNTYFVIHGDKADFRVGDPDEGIGLILKLLAQKNYLFEGGVVMSEEEPYSDRMKNHIGGTFEVKYVKYANRIITG
jgi:hypothetical protein